MINAKERSLELSDETIVVDWLMYRSYEFNRSRSPHIAPEAWRKIYFHAEIYETIYQGKNNDSHD